MRLEPRLPCIGRCCSAEVVCSRWEEAPSVGGCVRVGVGGALGEKIVLPSGASCSQRVVVLCPPYHCRASVVGFIELSSILASVSNVLCWCASQNHGRCPSWRRHHQKEHRYRVVCGFRRRSWGRRVFVLTQFRWEGHLRLGSHKRLRR